MVQLYIDFVWLGGVGGVPACPGHRLVREQVFRPSFRLHSRLVQGARWAVAGYAPWSQWMPYLPSVHVSQAVPLKPRPHSHTPVPLAPSKQIPFPKQTFSAFPGQGWHWGPK